MPTEFVLKFWGQTEADVLGWANEFRTHPNDATRLLLPAAEFLPQICAQYPGPTEPPIEPPTTDGQFIGDIPFNGSPVQTDGLKGQPWQYARFTIPFGLAGKLSQISYAENPIYGGQQFTKQVSFSKTVGDFSEIRCLGASGNIVVSFEHDTENAIRVQAGEVWYMNFDNKRENGQPSAGPADDGDFQITAGMPV